MWSLLGKLSQPYYKGSDCDLTDQRKAVPIPLLNSRQSSVFEISFLSWQPRDKYWIAVIFLNLKAHIFFKCRIYKLHVEVEVLRIKIFTITCTMSNVKRAYLCICLHFPSLCTSWKLKNIAMTACALREVTCHPTDPDPG